MKNLNLFHSYVPKSFLRFIYVSFNNYNKEDFISFEDFYDYFINTRQNILSSLADVIMSYITWSKTDSENFWRYIHNTLKHEYCNLNDEPKKIEKDLQQLINNIYFSDIKLGSGYQYKYLFADTKQKINLYFPKKKYGEPQKLLLEI